MKSSKSSKTDRLFSRAMAAAMDKAARGDFREITVGGSQHRRATPRIVSPEATRRFKLAMGVCLAPGCNKIQGHDGEHR